MDHAPNVSPRKHSTTNVWLLVSLLVSLLVLPLLEGLSVGRPLLIIGLTAIFLVGARAARSSLRFTTIVLLVVALPAAWATLLVDSKPLFVVHCVLGSAFYWLVGGVVVFLVIRTHAVTWDSVFGAISAYLLFGLAWALSYWAIHTVSPDVFSFASEQVTTPLGRIPRSLAWIQTVTGQFYVAVIIAWLVSALPRPGSAAHPNQPR